MISETDKKTAETYKKFLIAVVAYLNKINHPYFLLAHQKKSDTAFIRELFPTISSEHIIHHDDPQVIKGIIGNAKGIISSRYHASISALSSGVPTLGTSWSHKYEELFRAYNATEYLLNMKQYTLTQVEASLNMLIHDDKSRAMQHVLRTQAAVHKKEAKIMWDRVFETIMK
jgi:colanic acid/amylovoran biosynthesis protein